MSREGRSRPNPRRLYRDTERGIIFGVCAGVADYWGWKLSRVRAVTILGCIFLPQIFIIGYIILSFFLLPKPIAEPLYEDAQDEAFWRTVRVSPSDTFRNVRHKFREMDAKLQRMERYVTSRHYDLDREFRDLER